MLLSRSSLALLALLVVASAQVAPTSRQSPTGDDSDLPPSNPGNSKQPLLASSSTTRRQPPEIPKKPTQSQQPSSSPQTGSPQRPSQLPQSSSTSGSPQLPLTRSPSGSPAVRQGGRNRAIGFSTKINNEDLAGLRFEIAAEEGSQSEDSTGFPKSGVMHSPIHVARGRNDPVPLPGMASPDSRYQQRQPSQRPTTSLASSSIRVQEIFPGDSMSSPLPMVPYSPRGSPSTSLSLRSDSSRQLSIPTTRPAQTSSDDDDVASDEEIERLPTPTLFNKDEAGDLEFWQAMPKHKVVINVAPKGATPVYKSVDGTRVKVDIHWKLAKCTTANQHIVCGNPEDTGLSCVKRRGQNHGYCRVVIGHDGDFCSHVVIGFRRDKYYPSVCKAPFECLQVDDARLALFKGLFVAKPHACAMSAKTVIKTAKTIKNAEDFNNGFDVKRTGHK